MARDIPWDYRSDKDNLHPPDSTEYNFRPSGGLLGLRDRDRGGTDNNQQSNQHHTLQQTHHQQRNPMDSRDRGDYRDRDDRYERRTFSRDYDKDSRINNRGNVTGSMGGTHNRYLNQSGNMQNMNERRRLYNESRVEEPEWFSSGPTSQNDTIELRGFDEVEQGDDSDDSQPQHKKSKSPLPLTSRK